MGFLETIPSPRLGFSEVFLANHLATTDNLTIRKTKRQNTYQLKPTIQKSGSNTQQRNEKLF